VIARDVLTGRANTLAKCPPADLIYAAPLSIKPCVFLLFALRLFRVREVDERAERRRRRDFLE